MLELDEERTNKFLKDFELIEQIRTEKVNTEIKEYEDGHLFILLGYALDEDGQMQDTLIKRLEMALKVLEKNPNSKIIVTGGVPKKDNTEAKLMREWLLEKGISNDRIIPEGLATDTVENALFSMKHVEELGYKGPITVMSSASHIRRALTLFDVSDEIVGNSIFSDHANHIFDSIGEPDNEELIEKSTDKERLVMYRDLLRLNGIWQYPGIQR